MAIPHTVLAFSWIPFVVVLILTVVFAFIYVRYFQSKYDSELCSTLASIFGVVVALLTTVLMPVDIFLVSYMKESNGTFKHWAASANDRKSIEDGVLYAYYALYLFVLLFVFFILPFAYFFYEEGDEETTTRSRACSAIKFTAVFVLVALVLMAIGAFAPFNANARMNETEWEIFRDIFKHMDSSRGEDSVTFTICSLSLIGMIALIVYTGYGMSAWPMDLVKGRRSAAKERLEAVQGRQDIQAQIEAIRSKYRGRQRISRRDQRRIEALEEQDHVMEQREHQLEQVERSILRKCVKVFRPCEVLLGVICFIMALLVFLSLLLTNIDKVLNSGYKTGYALAERKLPNPIDITLVFAQQAFPMDYLLMVGMILYFFFCTMGGIQHIGIWFFCIRMYHIRVRRTKPQGLLFMCFILMFIVLALNILIYQITPQYTTFGNQHYVVNTNGTRGDLIPCSTFAPNDECVMTRMSLLLTRWFFKVWFFGACYFYASWGFLVVCLVSFVVALLRKRRSSIEGAVDRDDFDESDDDHLINA